MKFLQELFRFRAVLPPPHWGCIVRNVGRRHYLSRTVQ
jgi:hypothetical protein